MKLTRGHSCVLCQQRKVRCDKQKPCANCVKAQVDCRVVPPQPPRRRRKKPHERDLIERLKKYENLLAQHGVNFEPIADDLKASEDAHDVADLGQDLSTLKTSPDARGPDYDHDDGDEKLVHCFVCSPCPLSDSHIEISSISLSSTESVCFYYPYSPTLSRYDYIPVFIVTRSHSVHCPITGQPGSDFRYP